MAEYVCDLAFNFDHRPKPDGTYDLQLGFVKRDGNKWIPTTPIGIKKGDTLQFSIYDLTATSTVWKSTKLNAVIIEFSAAVTGKRNTPLKTDEVILNPTFYRNGTAAGAYFGAVGIFPYYHCDAMWRIDEGAMGHHCEMTVTAYVTKEYERGSEKGHEARKFVVDPEMIVDSNG